MVPSLLRWSFLAVVVAGCSSSPASTTSGDPSSDGGTPNTDPTPDLPPVTATDLGKSCGGGCAGAQICTVDSSSCESGHCLFDGRTTPSEAYCTADCSNAACPKGYACTDVPFLLKRACVRDSSAPTDDSSPRARGTLKVTGSIAPNGTPAKAFQIDQPLDTSPVAKLASMKCDTVFLHTDGTTSQESPPSEAVLEVYIAGGCAPAEARGIVYFRLPLKTGTFTGDDDVPKTDIQVFPPSGTEPVHYGYETNQSVLDVSVIDGAEKSSPPWRAKRVVVHLEGDLPKYTPCPDASCGTPAPLTLDLELLNIVSSNTN